MRSKHCNVTLSGFTLSSLFNRTCLELVLHSNSLYQILGILLISKTCIQKEIQEYLIDNHFIPGGASKTLLTDKETPTIPTCTCVISSGAKNTISSSSFPVSLYVKEEMGIVPRSCSQFRITNVTEDPLQKYLERQISQLTNFSAFNPQQQQSLEVKMMNFYNLFLFCVWNFLEK
jgi:hypothetical protein